jgi:hypothetical protein
MGEYQEIDAEFVIPFPKRLSVHHPDKRIDDDNDQGE